MNIWVVITSINGPMARYQEYLDLGWSFVVVGDKKSNPLAWVSQTRGGGAGGIHFLSYEIQEEMYPRLSSLIGPNTYARKNIGYLFAIQNGAEAIYETDDDTFLRFPKVDPVQHFSQGKTFLAEAPDHFFNPYNHFAKNQGLWPRGYPISRIGKDRWTNPDNLVVTENPGKLCNSDIVQTLVNLEPDVDAIYRLVINSEPIEFSYENNLVYLGTETYAPGNTQSTFWLTRDSFDFLYVPKHVDFRFCDILKMYIAQSQLDLVYAGFFTEQFRNHHDYSEDFRSEFSCYLSTERLVSQLILIGNGTDILSIYHAMVEINICVKEELPILEAYLECYREIR